MGWFLTGKKKRAPRKRKAREKKWDPRRTYLLLQWSLAVALLAAAGAGWFWGQRELREAVRASASTGPVKVELVDLPSWMPRPIAEQLQRELAELMTADPFDRQALRRAAEMLAASPWVEQVHRVSRRPGGLVEVSATYRQGVALVRTESGCKLIDARGVRLPFSYDLHEASRTGLPLLLGVRHAMPPAGESWAGDDLAAGMKLAACIAREAWSAQVAGIDVTNYAGRLSNRRAHLKIVTALDLDEDPFNNPGVEWGRPPGDERFYEPPPQWKLSRIAAEFERHGRLDDRIVQVTTEPGLTQRLPADETLVTATPRRQD